MAKDTWRCVIALNHLARLNEATLIWSPGHSGAVGNEEADRLAVAGSEQRLDDDSMNLVDMTISAVKTRLKLWAHQQCIDYWNDRPLLRHSRN